MLIIKHVELPPEYDNIKSVILNGVEYINDNYGYSDDNVVCTPISEILNQSKPLIVQG